MAKTLKKRKVPEIVELPVKKKKKVWPKVGKNTVIIDNKAWYPHHLVNMDKLHDNYIKHRYEDKGCANCEYAQERGKGNTPTYMCPTCPAYKGKYKLYEVKTIEGRKYIGLHTGDRLDHVKKAGMRPSVLDDIADRRACPKLGFDIKFTGKLRDHQKDAMKQWWGFKYGQVMAPPRSGKCVVGSTLIFSEDGIIPIKNLCVNAKEGIPLPKESKILAYTGTRTTSHVYKKYTNKTIKVVSTYGYSVEGTPEHPVQVLDPTGKHVWRRLDEITTGDYLCINRKESLWGGSEQVINFLPTEFENLDPSILPLPKYPVRMTPEFARILGYLTANGSLAKLNTHNGFSFCTNNKLVQSDFISSFKSTFGVNLNVVLSNKVDTIPVPKVMFRYFFRHIGFNLVGSAKKEIPEILLKSPKDILTHFLTAYLSCDSYFPKKGGSVQLCTASKKLHDQIKVILLNYGIVTKSKSSLSYARNSKTPVKRRYHSLHIGGENKLIFLKNFPVLKSVGRSLASKTKLKESPDFVPFVHEELVRLQNKYSCNNGFYKKNGESKLLKLFPTLKRYYLNKTAKRSRSTNIPYHVLKHLDLTALSFLSTRLAKNVQKILDTNFYYSRVKSVKEQTERKRVYDLTVPEGHSFIANGVVVHNTVLAVKFTLRLKLKTLILVHQGDLLDQMLQSFYDFTDIKDVEFENELELIGIAKKTDDFKKWPIVLSTYQKFISPAGKKRLEKLTRKFGLVIIDEVHRSASDCFSQVLSQFQAKHRLGFTATPKRKDCVVGSTLVEMSDGRKLSIRDIVIGDEVVSRNAETGNNESKTVYATHARKDSKLVKVTYNGESFICTPDEEFFSLDRNCFISARDLRVGEKLQEF